MGVFQWAFVVVTPAMRRRGPPRRGIAGRWSAGKVVPVRITGESRFGGWDAVNTETQRAVRIRGPQRLRRRVG